tara:strand:+ start:484 stop:639 length:156 start_codon:yes stop_codon:yes gene_type:complete
MVEIIGVTLFFDIVENKKHKDVTVNIMEFDITNARKNLHRISLSSKNNSPL